MIIPITITALGAFDADANGISGATHGGIGVFIYDLANTSVPLATVTVIGSSDPIMGQFRFKDIAPLTLAPGNYTVVAWGFDATDRNGNLAKSGFSLVTNNGGGLISFVNSRFSGLSGVSPEVTFPTSLTVPSVGCAGQPEACFAGGSFIFAAAPSSASADVNIHPTSFPNPVNVCTSGMGASTPVVIWGSDSFDVAEVDLLTLMLGTNELKTKGMTPNCSIADVGTPDDNATEVPCDGTDMACDGALWVEFSGVAAEDGHNDLTCHFYTKQLTSDVDVDGSTFSLPVTGDACTDGFIDPGTGLYDCSGSVDPELMPFAFSDEIKLNKKCLAAVEALQ